MRQFFALIFVVLLAVGSIAPAAQQPNFVIILADDLGYGDLSCYGSQSIRTLHLDRMAAEGLRFTDFHSNGTVCSPTRAALLTGRYQQRSGVVGVISAANHRDDGLGLDELTFAEVLRAAGYRTAMFGKWHQGYQPKFNPVHQGFDEFVGFVSGNTDYYTHVDQAFYEDWWHGDVLQNEAGYQTHLITANALKFLKREDDRPFVLYIPYGTPHAPDQDPFQPGRRVPKQFDKQQATTFLSKYNAQVPKRPTPLDGNRKSKQLAELMVEDLDRQVGELLTQLQEQGLAQNTLVFFTSDNGPRSGLSAGSLSGRKGMIEEGGHRVPAIAWWPGKIAPGHVTNQVALTMDLLPTLVSLADAELPTSHRLDGIDLSPLLLRDQPLTERNTFWGKANEGAIRHRNWKLIWKQGAAPRLYNLRDDLAERHNLAEQRPNLAHQLQDQLMEWHKEVTKNVEQFGNGVNYDTAAKQWRSAPSWQATRAHSTD